MGLVISAQYEVFSEDIAKGHVISYTPVEGSRVKKGDSVTITISKGPEEIPTPVLPFIDVNIDQVRSQMESLGLVVGKVEPFYSDQYAEGRVIWQSIPADTLVPPGTVIDFQVSKGPDPGSEPDPDPDPEPTDDIPIPSQGVDAPVSTKTISVDLSQYTGVVDLQIIVGTAVIHDSAVDCATNQTFTRSATGSGIQLVSIYINGQLVESYELDFNS